VAQAAAKPPDQGIGQVHQPLGDIALGHDESREDEKRDGHEAETVDAAEHVGHDQQQRIARGHRRHAAHQADRHEDGKPQQDEHNQTKKAQGDRQHAASSPASLPPAKGWRPYIRMSR